MAFPRINDYSEPCFWLSSIIGLGSIIYSIVAGGTYWIISSICLCFTGSLAAQRTHSLGLSKKIADSVNDFKDENKKLLSNVKELEESNDEFRISIGSLNEEIKDLKGITGLLDGTEKDLREVENKLRTIHQSIAKENNKHQNNNLVSLFTLVDKNRNSVLNKEEVNTLKKYVEIVYNVDIDFSQLDTNADGTLTLPEFINLFKN
jgi:septal ring factor EnvC (AmiA/AmiB activator)